MSDQNGTRYVYEYSGPDTNYAWTETTREVVADALGDALVRDAEGASMYGPARVWDLTRATTPYRVRRAV